MLIRIVKMTFDPSKIQDFKKVFSEVEPHIKKMKGCRDVQLKQDAKFSNIMFTVSRWESEEDLNNYRKTEFFHETWTKTKALFCARPEAWSLI